MAMDKVPMTVQGFRALDEDLKRLKTIERPAVTVAIGEARLHGDLKENAEYHSAKDRQGWIEGQIVQIGDMMARAQVIGVDKPSGSRMAAEPMPAFIGRPLPNLPIVAPAPAPLAD